jgi:hypothetical protein
MNFKLPLFIVLLLAGVIFVTGRACASGEGVFFLPNIAAGSSFDGLDVRDASNNRVNTARNISQLREIFESGLYVLLTQADLCAAASAVAAIRKSIDLASGTLARHLPRSIFQIFSALLPSKKNWDNMLTALLGAIGFVMTILFLDVLSTCSTPAAKSAAPSVLRL